MKKQKVAVSMQGYENEDSSALRRFTQAQAGIYAQALDEIRAGEKHSHWMWFIFPQLKGLGRSPTAQTYAIASLEEAKAYLLDPVLGARLRECTEVLLNVEGRTAHQIFGSPDDLKLRSSMTLFSLASPETACFKQVLTRYFGGETDARTLDLVARNI